MEASERELTQADHQARIEALVRQLGETEHALQELLAGDVDAVIDPVRGTPIVLRQAQAANILLRTLLDVMPVGVVVCDAEGTLLMTNPPGEEILGGRVFGTIESPKRTYAPCYPDGSPFPASEMPLVRAMELGETVENVEILIRREDGSERTILAGAAPVRDEAGQTVSGVTVFQDITARKKTERALRESQRDLARAQEIGQIGSWRLDVGRNVLTWSDENHRIFGVPVGTPMTYETFLDVVHPDDREYVDARWQTGLRGESYDIEHRIVVDGQIKWVREKAYLEFDETGVLVGGFGITQDITARKQAQAEIESLSRFPQENPNPVLRVARDGTLRYANEGSHPLVEAWRAGVGKAVPYGWQALVAEALDAGVVQAAEASCDDQVYALSIAPIVDGGYANLYGMDITERVRAQRSVQLYADRLRGLHEADQAILAARSVDEIAEAALRRVPDLLDCVRADVMLYDLDVGEMTLLAVHAAGETRVGKSWHGDIDDEWAAVLQDLAQGATYTVEDVQQAPARSPWREALRSEHVHALVVLPLLVEGRLIGSLNLGMRRPGQLSAGQREIAGELAIQLAIGIRQAELRAHVERHADELEQQVRRRTAALRASQARLQAIFDNAAVGIALLDLEGRVVESNPGLQKMLGYTAEELAGKHFIEFTHPSDAETDEALFQELLAGKRDSYSLSERYIRKDGSQLWGNLHASFIRDARGRLQYGVGLVEDITERREAQRALMQSEKLALTGRLAASLAHEINNPLQSVIGSLDLADESLVEGEIASARQMLQIGTEELQRASSIVTQLRDLSRPSEVGNRELADVKDLMDQVLLLTKKQCRKHKVEVVWEPGRDLPWLSVAPDQIKQVFLNLVLNAVEAMPDGGRLTIRALCTDEPEGVRITLRDTGPGIPPEVFPRLFEPFYTTKEQGLGLGLYVTYGIVDAHDGCIDVESRVGEGTTFTVWLPAEGG
jgi:PAS domain S-box-containing protein